jgi:hypothetical protein
MSDDIALALIGLMKTLVENIAPILGAVGALGALWVSIRNNRALKRNEMEVTKVAATVKLRDDEIDLLKTGAFRMGHLAGQKYVKDSDFSKLEDK